MNKWAKAGLIIGVLFILFMPAMLTLKTLSIFLIYSHYVDSVASLTGLNKYLVQTAVILLLIPLLIGIRLCFFSILTRNRRKKKYVGAAIIVLVLVVYNLGLFAVTKDTYFDFSEGKVSKWYASTPEGIRFFDSPGYDPKYGTKLKPVTPQIIANLEKKKRKMQPNKLPLNSLDKLTIFDQITGETTVWYYKDSSGNYQLFDGPGIHPTHGENLKPVTRQILLQIKEKQKEKTKRRKEEARRVAAKKAERRHEAYLNRYLLSESLLNQPQSTEVALLVIDETGKENKTTAQYITSRLNEKGFNTSESLFTAEFISDGKFDDIFNGNQQEVTKLNLSKYCDQILLGKSSANFTQNPNLENMLTAEVSTEFRLISTKTGAIESSFTLSGAGVGFSKSDAEKLALERIANRLKSRSF